MQAYRLKKNREEKSIFIHQQYYFEQLIAKFGLQDAANTLIPADSHTYRTKKKLSNL